MPPDDTQQPNQEPSQESKDKLRQIRANFTRSQTIIAELEAIYSRFTEIRGQLDDDEDGLDANHEWSKNKKAELTAIVEEAGQKLSELQTTYSSIESQVNEIKERHTQFKDLAEAVFDPQTGIEALFNSAKTLHQEIANFKETIKQISSDATATLDAIKKTHEQVDTAFTDFQALNEEVEDPKAGIRAKLEEVRQFADDALEAKTEAEASALSVASLKDETTKHRNAAKTARETTESLQKESSDLTDDIRNNLDMSTSNTLSGALRDQVDTLNDRLRVWGWILGIAIALLVSAIAAIFYFLYIYHTSAATLQERLESGPTLVSVVSKILFTSPLVYLVYFAASNFGRVRDLRDRFAFKGVVATNLQAYVKLLKNEFSEDTYKGRRFEFTLETMRNIYKEPEPHTRRRKYNIGVNKIFQFKTEHEDIHRLEDKLAEGAEEIVASKAKAKKSSRRKTAN